MVSIKKNNVLEEVLYYINILMKRTSETKTALDESKTEFISYLEELKQLLPGKGFESFTEEWVTQAVNNASRLYQLKEILDKQIKKVIISKIKILALNIFLLLQNTENDEGGLKTEKMKQFSEYISWLIFQETYTNTNVDENIPKSMNSTEMEKVITKFIMENFEHLKDFFDPDKIVELVKNPLLLLNILNKNLSQVKFCEA